MNTRTAPLTRTQARNRTNAAVEALRALVKAPERRDLARRRVVEIGRLGNERLILTKDGLIERTIGAPRFNIFDESWECRQYGRAFTRVSTRIVRDYQLTAADLIKIRRWLRTR